MKEKKDPVKSFIPSDKNIPELTVKSVLLGIILAFVMTAANTYLGLYAGMTVSASIPAAVISMAILRGILKKGTILENNIVQTMASAGESLAAGIIFTIPALIIVGVWDKFDFLTTTFIAISGGLLGIVFMIPLRKALIVEEKELQYPEGVACSEVLIAGEKGGNSFLAIIKGLLIGTIVKVFVSGIKIFKSSVEYGTIIGKKTFFFGFDVSPALIAVGYIIKLEIASLVFIGGAGAWLIGIPLLGIPQGMSDKPALDIIWELWSSKIRYIGVGSMVIGGIWSIISVRKGIISGLQCILKMKNSNSNKCERTSRDLSPKVIGTVLIINIIIIMIIYAILTNNIGITFLTTIIMLVIGFFFVAVSSYIVGLVGSSNNPISGMTICTLLFTAAFLLVLGFKGENAILATLGVAGVVCCSAATAGDCSQDLKTGYIIGSTPKYQQIAQIIGIVIPAVVIAPVLTLLHQAYGIGDGLKAPQATLFASITQALFGIGDLPWNMFYIGCFVSIILILVNEILKKTNSKLRTHVMPVAVGIYLPFTLTVPMLIGGIIRFISDKYNNSNVKDEANNNGILLSSGIIAGESVSGIIIAILIVFNLTKEIPINDLLKNILSTLAIIVVTIYLFKFSKKNN